LAHLPAVPGVGQRRERCLRAEHALSALYGAFFVKGGHWAPLAQAARWRSLWCLWARLWTCPFEPFPPWQPFGGARRSGPRAAPAKASLLLHLLRCRGSPEPWKRLVNRCGPSLPRSPEPRLLLPWGSYGTRAPVPVRPGPLLCDRRGPAKRRAPPGRPHGRRVPETAVFATR